MGTAATTAEYVGKRLGRAWRGLAHQEARATHWMVGHGMPQLAAQSILWIAKFALFAILLYVALWLALLLAIVLGAVWTVRNVESDSEPTEWAIGEQADHKESVFYDPINYNDTPDPRFDDD